jgi:phosphoribosylanthranilate isomerase
MKYKGVSPMWVKICGITRLEDAVSAATFGADAVGFVFADSPRRVTPDEARRLSFEMPDGPLKVGVFVDSPPQEVEETVRHCGLDLVQLHGAESPELYSALGDIAIKAVRVNGGIDIAAVKQYRCRALLFDCYDLDRHGGTGRTFDWRLLRLVDSGTRVIVAGGLNPGNVGQAVAQARPYGVDVSSGVEKEPGVKDPVLMYRFIENARKADYEVRRCQVG